MIENFESSDIGAAVCPWEKKEKNSPMLIEEGSGKDVVEELQNHNLHMPSIDQVYTLPTPTAQSTLKTLAAEAKAIPPSLPVQYFRKLVASV